MTIAPLAEPTLPAAFIEAAHAMHAAFVTGTDAECDAAAHTLTEQLRALPSDMTADADELLVALASTAAAEAAAARVAAQLPAAVLTGTRRLPENQEVRTLLLADGSEVAVVVPLGNLPATRAVRQALLAGRCDRCHATYGVDWKIVHAPSCLAYLHR